VGKRRKRNKEEEWIERVDWSEEAREEFRKRTEEIELGKGGVNEEMERLIMRIKEVVRVRKRRKRKEGGKGWRDGENKRKKREVEKTLKE